MRMRRRRVERLLARASEESEAGREDAAREALAEIEQLSPLEPRLAELRSRLDAASVLASRERAPEFPLVEQKIIPTVLVRDEITPTVENPPAALETAPASVVLPVPIEAAPIRAEPLIDLPLIVDQYEDRYETIPATTYVEEVPHVEVEETTYVEVEQEHGRRGRALAWAAAALLACGAMGWLIGSSLTQPTRRQPAAPAASESAAAPIVESATPPGAVEPARTEPPAPVQVAVDQIAAANTMVEAPPVAAESRGELPAQPAPENTRALDPRPASQPDPQPLRVDTPPPPDTPPPAPVTHALPAAAERPEPLPPVIGNSTPIERPTSPATSAAPSPPPVATAAPPVAATASPARDVAETARRDEEKIRHVLDGYASAYSRLDANAASAIFPGMDRRALARAFDGLSSQSVSLGTCDVRVVTETAMVDCAGTATWSPKVGGGSRTESRRWQFRMRSQSGEWQIVAAKVR